MSTVTTIIGRKGTGKTTAGVAHALDPEKRCIAVDSVGGVAEAMRKAGQAPTIVNYATDLIDWVQKPDSWGMACYQGTIEQVPLVLDVALSVGGVCVLVDELDTFEGEPEIFNGLKNQIRLARNRDLDLILTAKRRAGLPVLTMTEVDRLMVFHTLDQATLKECGALHPDFVNGIVGLAERFEFIEYRPAGHELEPGNVTPDLQVRYHSDLVTS